MVTNYTLFTYAKQRVGCVSRLSGASESPIPARTKLPLSSDPLCLTLVRGNELSWHNLVVPTTNGRVKMGKSNRFDLPLSSLDGELASFINSLLEQNADLAEKLEFIDSLTELAEKKLIDAAKEAEAIKAAAEMEANARAAAIVAEAEGKTEGAVQQVIAKAKEKAEAEAKRIIAEAGQRSEESAAELRKKAEEEALLLRREAEQLLASRKPAAKSLAEVSQELCAKLDTDETIKATCMEGDDKAPGALDPDDALHSAVDVRAEKPIEDPSFAEQEGDERESSATYGDFVDMVLPPAISLDRMFQLYRQLNKNLGVKVIAVKGSLDKGLWIRFIVRPPTPLLDVFEGLAEVDRLSYSVIEVGKIFSAQKIAHRRPAVLQATLGRHA
jgi:hypothetical protein